MSHPLNPYLDDFSPIVESVASDMGRRYFRYGMERDDMSQVAYVWIFDHPDKVLDWLHGMEPKDFERILAKTLRNECHDAGESAKADHLGYSREDLVYYSKATLRDLLPAVFDEEAWLHPEQGDGERRAPSDPATGGNWLATLADVARAFKQLSAEDKDLLIAFHKDEIPNKILAQRYSVTEQTMSYRHDRVLHRLVKILGGPKPRPQHDEECNHWAGGRRAMSNAAARAAQSSYYEED